MSDPTPSEPPPADAYQISEVTLTDIRVFKRLRPLEPARVEALAASMEAEGLRHPIVVRGTTEGYDLILGRHRLEAARQLKWHTIRASIFFDMTADQAAIVEVEGNLVSRLTDDEYANRRRTGGSYRGPAGLENGGPEVLRFVERRYCWLGKCAGVRVWAARPSEDSR